MKPESPAHRRPNDRPYYIQTTCNQCGAALVYSYLLKQPDIEADRVWYDEFSCPHCRDGVYMDWPPEFKKAIFEDK